MARATGRRPFLIASWKNARLACTIEFSFSLRASTCDMVRAKLCVACCLCLLTVCCVWGAYDGACLNSLGCSLGAPQRARHFIFKIVGSPSARAFDIPIINLKINQSKIDQHKNSGSKNASGKKLGRKRVFFESIFRQHMKNSLIVVRDTSNRDVSSILAQFRKRAELKCDLDTP